jgi:hypothetical protein
MFRQKIGVIIKRRPYALELLDKPRMRRYYKIGTLWNSEGMQNRLHETGRDRTRQDKTGQDGTYVYN